MAGTLRDQLIYPLETDAAAHECWRRSVAMGWTHELEAAGAGEWRGALDKVLRRLLRVVDPADSILTQFSLSEDRDWAQTLSGGQKQRVAMARLFFQLPKYAILDECTSAVSAEVESRIYEASRVLGISLFTVSHKLVLMKFHEYRCASVARARPRAPGRSSG